MRAPAVDAATREPRDDVFTQTVTTSILELQRLFVPSPHSSSSLLSRLFLLSIHHADNGPRHSALFLNQKDIATIAQRTSQKTRYSSEQVSVCAFSPFPSTQDNPTFLVLYLTPYMYDLQVLRGLSLAALPCKAHVVSVPQKVSGALWRFCGGPYHVSVSSYVPLPTPRSAQNICQMCSHVSSLQYSASASGTVVGLPKLPFSPRPTNAVDRTLPLRPPSSETTLVHLLWLPCLTWFTLNHLPSRLTRLPLPAPVPSQSQNASRIIHYVRHLGIRTLPSLCSTSTSRSRRMYQL